MRTAADFPEDLHRIVSSLAVHTRRSLSVTAVELIWRGPSPLEMTTDFGPLSSEEFHRTIEFAAA